MIDMTQVVVLLCTTFGRLCDTLRPLRLCAEVFLVPARPVAVNTF